MHDGHTRRTTGRRRRAQRSLLALALAAASSACSLDTSATGTGSLPDARLPDADVGADAARMDGSNDPDAGRADGGDATPDGASDGGVPDAGIDSGTTDCRSLPAPPGANPLVLYDFAFTSPLPVLFADESGRSPFVPVGADGTGPPFDADMPGGLVRFRSGRLVASQDGSDLVGDVVTAAGSLSVEAWLATENTAQTAPNRIVTISSSAQARVLTIAQNGSRVVARVHTSATNANGNQFNDDSPASLQWELFPAPGPVHVVVVYDGARSTASLLVNGELVQSLRHDDGSGSANLVWTRGQDRIALGDEVGSDTVLDGAVYSPRHWQGELHTVALYDRAVSVAEAACLFMVGPR